ncbi:MAG: hypothetical protein ABIN58_06120 [candidate division WOR-3 bacterium]
MNVCPQPEFFWGDSCWARWEPGVVWVGNLDEWGLGAGIKAQLWHTSRGGIQAAPRPGCVYKVFKVEVGGEGGRYVSPPSDIMISEDNLEILGHEGWHSLGWRH